MTNRITKIKETTKVKTLTTTLRRLETAIDDIELDD